MLTDRQMDLLQKAQKQFCKLVAEAIPDEKKGAADYNKMIGAAHQAGLGEEVFKTLWKIMDDEGKHKAKLEKLHRRFCKR